MHKILPRAHWEWCLLRVQAELGTLFLIWIVLYLKIIVCKWLELKLSSKSNEADPKQHVYHHVPDLTHFPYPAKDVN